MPLDQDLVHMPLVLDSSPAPILIENHTGLMRKVVADIYFTEKNRSNRMCIPDACTASLFFHAIEFTGDLPVFEAHARHIKGFFDNRGLLRYDLPPVFFPHRAVAIFGRRERLPPLQMLLMSPLDIP